MQAKPVREGVSVPSTITSSEAKLVYVYLATSGETTAADLSQALSVPQLSVRSVLRELGRAGLVERTGDRVRVVASDE